jgi:FAD/FMN-containing dehydrogenase
VRRIGLRLGRSPGAGLTGSSGTPPLPPFPRDFEGSVFHGEDAARHASLVSGPFHAEPPAYAVPGDRESLEVLLRWAWEDRIALIPRGAGTGMPGGNLGPYTIVELGEAFADIRWLDDDGDRVRVGAGAVAEVVDLEARRRGRFLPFLPSSARWCRVGGMVANNAAGARSFRYGAASRWVEALEGHFAWGEMFRVGMSGEPSPRPFADLHAALRPDLLDPDGTIPGWPAVRKNSSAYALDRFLPTGDAVQLLAGSEGTLAIVTDVELRTAPLPEERALVRLRLRSPEELTATALRAAEAGATACEFFGRRFLEIAGLADELGDGVGVPYALALLEVSGSPEEVNARLDALERTTGEAWDARVTRDEDDMARLWAIRHAASPTIAREAERGRLSTQFIEDSVVPPAALGAYLDGLDRILREARFDAIVFGHAGDANVHVNPLIDPTEPDWEKRARRALTEVADLVQSLGGTLSGEHGDGRLRAPLLGAVWPDSLVRIFERVKRGLDPRGILNPGVILPLPGQDPFEGFAPRLRAYPHDRARASAPE